MAGHIRSNKERVEVKQISATINKEICREFKDCCKVMGYPINVMIEIFMRQYVDGEFSIQYDKIEEWNKGVKDKMVLNTTINLEVFNEFKDSCKSVGYPINAMLTGFMKQFIDEDYVLEFKKIERNN